MSRIGLLASIVLAFGVGVLVVVLTRPSSAREGRVDLNVGGPPGLVVTGTYSADGLAHAFTGTTPTNFVVFAHELTYSLQTTSQVPGLRVTLYVDDLPRTSTLAGTNGGVRGRYQAAPDSTNWDAVGF